MNYNKCNHIVKYPYNLKNECMILYKTIETELGNESFNSTVEQCKEIIRKIILGLKLHFKSFVPIIKDFYFNTLDGYIQTLINYKKL